MPQTPAPWIVVTGLDGAGKTTLAGRLAVAAGAHFFRLPYHDFVPELLRRSGQGTPFGDVHTDRLIFAADARLTNDLIRQWRRTHRCLVSQRWWMDNYIFGAVQGMDYQAANDLFRTAELESASAIIYLLADPAVAFARIEHDPGRDKYETAEFLAAQYQETLRFREAVRGAAPYLSAFAGIAELLIDTTRQETDVVYQTAKSFLDDLRLL